MPNNVKAGKNAKNWHQERENILHRLPLSGSFGNVIDTGRCKTWPMPPRCPYSSAGAPGRRFGDQGLRSGWTDTGGFAIRGRTELGQWSGMIRVLPDGRRPHGPRRGSSPLRAPPAPYSPPECQHVGKLRRAPSSPLMASQERPRGGQSPTDRARKGRFLRDPARFGRWMSVVLSNLMRVSPGGGLRDVGTSDRNAG
jgi:hypothetical protein